MKRSITLPTIRIDYFNTVLFDGSTTVMYHLYVNGEFYRAYNSHDDLEIAVNAIAHVELTGV